MRIETVSGISFSFNQVADSFFSLSIAHGYAVEIGPSPKAENAQGLSIIRAKNGKLLCFLWRAEAQKFRS